MSFSLVVPAGFLDNTRLFAATMQQLQEYVADAVDGAGGGSYTLSAPLSFSGNQVSISNLSVTGLAATSSSLTTASISDLTASAATVTGLADLRGSVNLGDSSADVVTVDGTASFTEPVTLNGGTFIGSSYSFGGFSTSGNVTIGGSLTTVTLSTSGAASVGTNLTATGNVSAGGSLSGSTLAVTSTALISGNTTMGADATVSGDLAVTGTSELGGSVTCTGSLTAATVSAGTVSGTTVTATSGVVQALRYGNDGIILADQAYTLYATTRLAVALAGTLSSSSRAITLNTTGAPDWFEWEFASHDTSAFSFTIAVTYPTSTTILLSANTGSSRHRYCRIAAHGGSLYLMQAIPSS